MAPPARKISKEEWERHSDTIHDLYQVRRLPLHSEKGDPSVLQIMRDEHHFSASLSQYEAYFKKSEQPKNLKKEEWRAVHLKLSELSALNIEARVKVSGHVLSKARIERSRRHAIPGLDKLGHNASSGLALPSTRRVAIETRGADGEWSTYVENTVADNLALVRSPLPANDHASFGKAPFEPGASTGTLSNEESLLSGSPSLPWDDPSFLANFSPLSQVNYPWDLDPRGSQLSERFPPNLDFPGSPVDENLSTPRIWATESLFLLLQAAVLAKPKHVLRSPHKFHEYTGAGYEWDLPLSIEARLSPETLVHSLLEDATKILISSSRSNKMLKLPDLGDVMDSLISLLPESPTQDSLVQTAALAVKDFIFDSPFYSALLFSIANGFAGLRNIPSGAILRMLKKHHKMSSQIFDCLRSSPPALAKSLADNLFRAAIEACDEQTVVIILQGTRNSPNAIDPNNIACQINGEGRLYTPIELAAKFRHLGIVQTLLAANADVNKTYEEDEFQERGALELAVRKWGEYEAVDMKLVRTLLDCHAEVRVDLAGAAVRWGQTDLIQDLISRLSPSSHRTWFKNSVPRYKSMLVDVARYLGNNLATQIIKQVFKDCEAESCMCCSINNQRAMEDMLCYATRRENLELVEFLLPQTTEINSALSAAVRNGSRKLIDLLLQYGASVSAATRSLDDHSIYANDSASKNEDCPYFLGFTTPLAEAIRSQNKDLVQEFEILGALSNINDERIFEAVMFAAAEVGDLNYLQKLLGQVPKESGKYLKSTLNVTVRYDKTEIALKLLDAGADVNAVFFSGRSYSPLLTAIRRQNKIVVEGILEADIKLTDKYISSEGTLFMEAAALWGDIPIIEDLIFMGAEINDGHQITALAAAVKSKNKTLVELLLKSGASPSKRAKSGVSPLEMAIANDDMDMIQLLLSNAADPADDRAFLLAIENSQKAFKILLEKFSVVYPRGKKSFGENILIKAIEKEDVTLLNTLLVAKFDVNGFTKQDRTLLTALSFAIMYRKGRDLELVQKLINAGGDPNIIVRKPDCDREGLLFHRYDRVPRETALMVAIKTRSKKMVELLLKNGANLHQPARKGLKRTPLQQACEIGSFKMVKLLVENGANVNEPPADRDGATALQLAAISGSIQIAQYLLDRGALVHACPAMVRGRSAFEGAAEHGCLEMIRVLWDAVSGIGFTPEQIERAIKLAQSKGHRGCAEYIASLSSGTSLSLPPADSFVFSEME